MRSIGNGCYPSLKSYLFDTSIDGGRTATTYMGILLDILDVKDKSRNAL
jgi:hypothetical protein